MTTRAKARFKLGDCVRIGNAIRPRGLIVYPYIAGVFDITMPIQALRDWTFKVAKCDPDSGRVLVVVRNHVGGERRDLAGWYDESVLEPVARVPMLVRSAGGGMADET